MHLYPSVCTELDRVREFSIAEPALCSPYPTIKERLNLLYLNTLSVNVDTPSAVYKFTLDKNQKQV